MRTDARVLVVGAGPAGLAMATALGCHDLADDLEVVDPSGGWLTSWHRRFAAQAIGHLRSPAVHHPHPDPFALLGSCAPDELVPAGGTKLPTTAAFARFCDRLVHRQRLDERLTATAAVGLEIDRDGRPTVHLGDGTRRRPERVVLAGNVRRPQLPGCVHELVGRDPRVATGESAHVADTPPGGHVVVVGGGLSAAHLALGAAERGAEVTLVSRRNLTVRRFDTHPSWLGPKKRRPFEAEPDPAARRRMIDHARGGGSIPHPVRRRLDDGVATGRVRLRERTELDRVAASGERLQVHTSDGRTLPADRLWLATGGAVDVDHDPLCRPLRAARPVALTAGMVDLDPDLSWPGTRVHLVGAAASLVLGPTAGNLVGQRRAASRVLAAVRGADPAAADRIATGTGACPAAPVNGRRVEVPA